MALSTTTVFPAGQAEVRDHRLEVIVLVTDESATVSALKKAFSLTEGLQARVCIVAVQIVPFPLPLDEPPVRMGRALRSLLPYLSDCGAEQVIQICYSRERIPALRQILPPHSLIVMGHSSSFLANWRANKWRKWLKTTGHDVIVA